MTVFVRHGYLKHYGDRFISGTQSENPFGKFVCTHCQKEYEPYEIIQETEQIIYTVNPDDFDIDGPGNHFFRHIFIVSISAKSIKFKINADDPKEALDETINFIESNEMPGLLLPKNEVKELEQKGFITNYIMGGQNQRYLSSQIIEIKILN
jgi:hypothetical protein